VFNEEEEKKEEEKEGRNLLEEGIGRNLFYFKLGF
jgi:hypothetical protein